MRRDDRPSVVATGLGAVSPIGVGAKAFSRGLREGRSGVRLIEPPLQNCKSTVAAFCDEFDPAGVLPAAELRRLPRLVPMALAACREALEMAGLLDNGALRPDVDGRRVGLILGTGGGGIDFTLDQAKAHYTGGKPSLWTITNATHGNLAGELSIRLGLRGPSWCVSTGCASSSDAIGLALEALRSDRAGSPEIAVVVGADAHIRWETLRGMELLGVVTTRNWRECREDPATASRPFDVSRDGFVLGEGAWAFVLEREGVATERDARALATMLGYGATCDAHHRVRPAPDMRECARAIEQALADAGLAPDDVQAAQFHGTGTRLNDELEAQAMRLSLGPRAGAIQGSSVKSMVGHPQGASGAAGLAALVAGLASLDTHPDGSFIAPTINVFEQDPACALDVTPSRARLTDARVGLVNCLAFGAKNSALIVRVER